MDAEKMIKIIEERGQRLDELELDMWHEFMENYLTDIAECLGKEIFNDGNYRLYKIGSYYILRVDCGGNPDIFYIIRENMLE